MEYRQRFHLYRGKPRGGRGGKDYRGRGSGEHIGELRTPTIIELLYEMKKSRYKRKSNAQALRTSSKTLESMLDIMRDLISNLSYEQNPGTNLTKAERRALTKLKEDNFLNNKQGRQR